MTYFLMLLFVWITLFCLADAFLMCAQKMTGQCYSTLSIAFL